MNYIEIWHTLPPKGVPFTACEPTITGIDVSEYRWNGDTLQYSVEYEPGCVRWCDDNTGPFFYEGTVFLVQVGV